MIELECKGIAGSSLDLSTIYYINGRDPHVDQGHVRLHCREVALKVAVAVAQEAIQSGSALSEEGQCSKVEPKNLERHLQDLQYDPFKAPHQCSHIE